MDYGVVVCGDIDILVKISDVYVYGYYVDGYVVGLNVYQFNVMCNVGLDIDYECMIVVEVQDCVWVGMVVFLCEGMVECDVLLMIGVVIEVNVSWFVFCMDDKMISDLFIEGLIDYNVCLVMQSGMCFEFVYILVSFNGVMVYCLSDWGSLLVGQLVDLVVLDDFEYVRIVWMMKWGQWILLSMIKLLLFIVMCVQYYV